MSRFVDNCRKTPEAFHYAKDSGNFRSEFKWKDHFWFLSTGIFGITSRRVPLISVGIFRLKVAVPFLTNQFFALIREFGLGVKSGKSHSYWLAWFNRKRSLRFPRVFPLICDRSVWHNGKHPPTYVHVRLSFKKLFQTRQTSKSNNKKKLSKTGFRYDYALFGKLKNYLDTRIKSFLA